MWLVGLIAHPGVGREADTLVDRILRLDPIATRRCKQFFQTAQQNAFDQNCRLAAEALTVDSLARLPPER